VRFAILISFAACGLTFSPAWADGPFIRIALGSRSAYIVPEEYAGDHRADLVASIPGSVKIDDFWTPPEQDVAVADRVFRELIHGAIKDPALLFPDLKPNPNPDAPIAPDSFEYEQNELALVSANYDRYARQYVGIVIAGQKLILCNYSEGTKVDPSAEYIFIQKAFVPGGKVHFLQCRFEPWSKIGSNVSMIGSWQKVKGDF
jgi:hypothetical protein